MSHEEGNVEIKFRIFDGTDIAHGTYASSTTVAALQQRIFADWPQENPVVPESVEDIKIIHAGKFLVNEKTLAESQVIPGDINSNGGGIIIMHVVVQPSAAKKEIEKNQQKEPKHNVCSCCIC